MRSFFKFCLSLLFIILLPVGLLLALPKLNGFSIDKLKTTLMHEQVYDKASSALHEHLASVGSPTAESSPEDQIVSVVKGELTATYLQTKVETMLDQTAAWTVDSTQPAPSLSFNDLQQKLVAQNPVAKQQIDEALAQLKTAQSQNSGQLPQVTGDDQSQQALQQLLQSTDNLDTIVNGDWTFSLKQPLAGLPTAYKYYIIGLPVLGIILAALLLGILGLGQGWPGRLKSVGWVLLVTAVWNGLLAGAFWFILLGENMWRYIPISGNDGAVVKTIWHSIQSSVWANYVTIESVVSLVLLVLAVVALIMAKMLAPKAVMAPAEVATSPTRLDSEPIVEDAGKNGVKPLAVDEVKVEPTTEEPEIQPTPKKLVN